MAPEVLTGHTDYCRKADVYSFAVVLWEIAAQTTPWNELPDSVLLFPRQLMEIIVSGRRPRLNPEWLPTYRNLLEACWATDPRERPEFAEIVNALSDLKTKLEYLKACATAGSAFSVDSVPISSTSWHGHNITRSLKEVTFISLMFTQIHILNRILRNLTPHCRGNLKA